MAGAELLEGAVSSSRERTATVDTAQLAWAARPIGERLHVLKQARRLLARHCRDLVEAIPAELTRTPADTRVAEILPLLAACRFLETSAARMLAPRRLGRGGLPFWLSGIASEVHRVPFGSILVIGPANYPLFLPGVQILQALCAGNAVVWKPGLGGGAVAEVVAAVLDRAGLPQGLLRVTEDSVEAGVAELQRRPDKIFFTGSASAGRAILHVAAESAIPVVAELSGCDAVHVLPSADPDRVVDALTFGMRLNGSATCMAPRRLVLIGQGHQHLIARLRERFSAVPGIVVNDRTRDQLLTLVRQAESARATVCGEPRAVWLKPLLILNGKPEMAIAQADIFAPVLTVIEVADQDEAVVAESVCPYGLTAAIFGQEHDARQLGNRLRVGTVLINDLIVPTVDPRVPFTGRRASGFGPTRGTEGLLEMTAVKAVLVRKSRSRRHFQETGDAHNALFDGIIQTSHAATWSERWLGIKQTIAAGRSLK